MAQIVEKKLRNLYVILARKANILFRIILQKVRSLKARIQGQTFDCKHISGHYSNAEMAMVINSDLSLTCNSDDFYGNGQLGSLKTHTLAQILKGEKASRFRVLLAKGILPIPECSNCSALVKLEKNEERPANFGGKISSILIENTAKCNIDCISCPRPQIMANRKSYVMSDSDVEKVIKEVSKYPIESIGLFNLGEPFLSRNILLTVRLINSYLGPVKIVSSTNGTLLNGIDKMTAALYVDELYFTIPGVNQATVEKYQKGQKFDIAYQNLINMVKFRDDNKIKSTLIIWKYLIFNWNDEDVHLEKAIQLATEAKVDIIKFVICLSPFYGISTKFLFNKLSLKKLTGKNSSITDRHTLEVVSHKEINIVLR